MDYSQTGFTMDSILTAYPHPHSAIFYPVSGILGELGYLSIGVGYNHSFQMFAALVDQNDELAGNLLISLTCPELPSPYAPQAILFRWQRRTPARSTSTHYKLRKAALSDIQFYVMQEIANTLPGAQSLEQADKGRFDMFDKVSGSKEIRERFSKTIVGKTYVTIGIKMLKPSTKLSKQYYLYKWG